MMNVTKFIKSRELLRNSIIRPLYVQYSTQIEQEKIEIPKRIERGPTDILRALESTVGRDLTAAHYKYHDDPYLIPTSNVSKRTFAMAQEAGRKAAHWIRREHADLFNSTEAEPQIEKFLPPMIYTENSEVSEKDLQDVIKSVQVSDAKLIYKLLKDKGIEISEETQQSLLELICFQNGEDALSDDFIEERWFKQSSRSKEKQRKTWKDGDFAEEIFISMKKPGTEAYSALIQGMIKYHQIDKAWQLYEEVQQKQISLNTDTYNALISIAHYLKENYEMRIDLAINLLSQIKQNKLKPNLQTLNAMLLCTSTMSNNQVTRQHTLRILSEFKNIGIEPSLASWYYVLITFCKERGPKSTILYDIMNEIENKEHKIQDLKDTNFFVTAMDICRNHLNDIELAKRVDALLHYKNNYDLIGDSYKESIYFRHYFALFCANLPLEEFMNDIYYKLVPHIYVPEPGIMLEVLNQVDLSGSVEFIPRLWSDMIMFDHVQRENLVELILNIMVNNEGLPDSEINKQFGVIGWDIYTRIDGQNENKFNKLSFSGDLLGKIMMLLLRCKEFEKACVILDRLEKDHNKIVGVPKIDALSLFVDACIENQLPSRAIACIQYCSDSGFGEAPILAARLNEKLSLDERHLSQLSRIVGTPSLKLNN